ncbi:MAG TPA: hypothetical protein VIJ22_05600 [Polyangiaceae bacterium]
MIRQHDTYVIAHGTLRVVLTRSGRVAAVIDLEESALGPLHLLFEVCVERGPIFQTGSLLGGLTHGIEHVSHDLGNVEHDATKSAEHAFHAAASVAKDVALPAFQVVKDAASSGAHLIASAPHIVDEERKRIVAASRVVMRAKLGDITAKNLVRGIVHAAEGGVNEARHAASALLTGGRLVAHVLDTPLRLAEHIPLIGGTLHELSPWKKLEQMTSAIQHGDFKEMKKIVTDEAHMVQGLAALVPGLGSGIGAAIGTGLAVLDGGGALDVAIHAAYGAIPIPPGVREITDTVLEAVLKLAHHGSLTDAVLAGARSGVPEGLPRHVFDTLAHLVIKRVPIKKAAEELVGHYVQRYAPAITLPKGVAETVEHVVRAERAGAGAAIHLAAAGNSPLRLARASEAAPASSEGR